MNRVIVAFISLLFVQSITYGMSLSLQNARPSELKWLACYRFTLGKNQTNRAAFVPILSEHEKTMYALRRNFFLASLSLGIAGTAAYLFGLYKYMPNFTGSKNQIIGSIGLLAASAILLKVGQLTHSLYQNFSSNRNNINILDIENKTKANWKYLEQLGRNILKISIKSTDISKDALFGDNDPLELYNTKTKEFASWDVKNPDFVKQVIILNRFNSPDWIFRKGKNPRERGTIINLSGRGGRVEGYLVFEEGE